MERIVTVKEQSYGIVELDVDKVIALVADKRMLLFEYAYWVLDKKEDFDKVSTIWHELKKQSV